MVGEGSSAEARVALTAGSIFGEKTNPQLAAYAELVSKKIRPDHRNQLAHPIFSNANEASLVVIASSQVPVPEQFKVMETMVDLLASVYPNRAVAYVFTPEKLMVRSELGELDQFMKVQQERKDATGKPIGRRFNVVVTTDTVAVSAYQKAFSGLASALSGKGLDIMTLLTEYSVLVVEEGVKVKPESRVAARLLRSDEFKNPWTGLVRDVIASLYGSLKGNAEALKNVLGDVYILNGKIVTEALTASVVEKLLTDIKAAAAREQAA